MSKEVNEEERTPRTVADVKEMLTKHSNGEIQRTIQNCITILQNDHVLADAIRLNLLSERIDIVKTAAYSGIGINKLRSMSDNEHCQFVLWVGSKRLIKRRKLDEYTERMYSL